MMPPPLTTRQIVDGLVADNAIEEEMRNPMLIVVSSMRLGADAREIERDTELKTLEPYATRLRQNGVWLDDASICVEPVANEEECICQIVLLTLVADGRIIRDAAGLFKPPLDPEPVRPHPTPSEPRLTSEQKKERRNATKKKLSARRREQGLCILCGSPIGTRSKAMCDRHAETISAQRKEGRRRALERCKLNAPRVYTVEERLLSKYELAELTGISVNSIVNRIRAGYTPEDIVRMEDTRQKYMASRQRAAQRAKLSPDEAWALVTHHGSVSAAARVSGYPRRSFRKILAKKPRELADVASVSVESVMNRIRGA